MSNFLFTDRIPKFYVRFLAKVLEPMVCRLKSFNYEKRLVEKFVYAETENICSILIFRDYIPFDWLALARYTVNNSQSKAQGFTELSQRNGDKLL